MGSVPANTEKLSTRVDGVPLSAPASVSKQELKQLRWAQVPFRGNPHQLDAYVQHVLESRGYAERFSRLEASGTDFGESVLDVRLRAGGIKAQRLQGGVTRIKKKTFLWITAIGVFFLLIGIEAAWLGVLLLALGGGLYVLTPTAVHYWYRPAAVVAWIQGDGTGYKGTHIRKMRAAGSNRPEHTVQTSYVDSEMDLTLGTDIDTRDVRLDKFLLAEDEPSDGVLGLLKAIAAGRKEITIGSKEKYAELLPDEAALEKYAADELKELRAQLAKA